MIRAELVAANLERLKQQIESSGRDPAEVTIVAVTKGLGDDAVAAAAAVGLEDVGENYAQEIIAKHDTAPGLRWHFIGRLQSNKVAQVAGLVDEWQTLDRAKLARLVAKHDPGADVRIQVNISGEPAKGGCAPSEASELVALARSLDLNVVGLMGVASVHGDQAAEFGLLRRLADEEGLPGCSMGMSNDLGVALRAGSTMIRVGTALFGPRPVRERGT